MAGDTHILVSPFQAQTSDGKSDLWDFGSSIGDSNNLLFEKEVLDIQSIPHKMCCKYTISLKTYTKVVGWTYLVMGIITIIGSIAIMAFSREMVPGVVKALGRQGENMDKHSIASGVLIFGVVLLIVSIVATVLSACLIQGAKTRNVRLMKPWIVLTGISLVPGLGLVIFALIKLPMQFTLHCITMWVCTSYCLKMVWLYKAEVEADNGLRGYLDNWGKLHHKREDGEVVEA
jgi:hypothetical protein